ncbi:MAG: alpha-ketoacid dehydrogenase subunit beta [Salinisphaera sp.]|uniref:alpha-ketoacid dehydrogenase subunit beta n=1 Tax=Salinisphaera sp. TaxID=1914330 RepID=UPI003C7D94B1
MPDAITFREAMTAVLRETLAANEEAFLLGEDVGVYGGAFGVSRGLVEEFGTDRVLDTPLSEAGFTGLAIGAAVMGMRPIVEIQFSDFITHCMDQLVNQAAKLRYMFGGAASVPLVLRTPGGAGTGAAAQHSQSLEAWFVHVPGLRVVMPSTPADAQGLFRAAMADPNPVLFYEHKLLYNTKGSLPDEPETYEIGRARCTREGRDVTVAAAGLMHNYALEAAETLAGQNIDAEVINLLSLAPMDSDRVCESVRKTGRLVVVEEDVRTGGWGGELITRVTEGPAFYALDRAPARVACADTPIPYNKRLEASIRPSPERIVEAVTQVLANDPGRYV